MSAVYVLTHQYRHGVEVRVFKNYKDAVKTYKTIMKKYSKEYGISPNATDDEELLEASGGDSSMSIVESELE
jgi:hypothetical protein